MINQLCDNCKKTHIIRAGSLHSRGERIICTPCRIDMQEAAWEAGHECGYAWLTNGPNFKHPKAPGGYIPGGPMYFTDTYIRGEAWHKGFKTGLNQYVRENNLDYPEI